MISLLFLIVYSFYAICVQDDDEVPDESRLADEVSGAESKNSERAGGVDAQSKLVKDIMSRQVEQEAAVRGNTKIEVSDDTSSV